MNVKSLIIGTVLGAPVAVGCASVAQEGPPVVDIGGRHGNLRAAQEHIVQAWQMVDAAQVANDARLGGHAGRAKQLLSQANDELRLAADVANERRY